MEVRQAWTIRLETPTRRTSGSTKLAVSEPDVSRRGTREDGKAKAVLLLLTLRDGDVAVTVVEAATARVARVLAAVGVGCELTSAGAARELVVLGVSGAADMDAGADAPPGFPLPLLLV
jgi:hypothetical protein